MQGRGDRGALHFADEINNVPDSEVMLRTLLDYSVPLVGTAVVRRPPRATGARSKGSFLLVAAAPPVVVSCFAIAS